MESSTGLPNSRSYTGKEILLPPLSPFPCVLPFYSDLSAEGSNGISKPTEELCHHQRCSSESFLIEEQPSWLEELLDEPDTLLHKGHRRSASDSSAYLDTPLETFNWMEEHTFNNFPTAPSWSFQRRVHNIDLSHGSFNTNPRSFGGQLNTVYERSLKAVNCSNSLSAPRNGLTLQTPGSICGLRDDSVPSSTTERHDWVGYSSQSPKSFSERGDFYQVKTSASNADAKRAKQQSAAHRSRVRKLQYITELERNVQVLQAEGSQVFSEIEFLDQHNLISSMENRALRQRLDSLSQEQLIKHLEHEMLERELGRLQSLLQLQMQQQHQQQQQQKEQNIRYRRAKTKDLESQLASLSISYNEASSSTSSVSGSVRI